MDLLYHHAQYGGDRGRAPAVDEKVMFLSVCLSLFGMTKFVITETL